MKFVPYVCCGDPNMDFTFEMVRVLAPFSSMIELGIPFSDPIADGKAIQNAATRALKNGADIDKIFAMVEKLRKEVATPFVFMTYYNIVYSYGRERFLQKMRKSSVQGLIIPDLPFGQDLEFEKLTKRYGISIINLIAPNTSLKRARTLLQNSGLFTYLVSVAGTTGAREKVNPKSLEFVRNIRSLNPDGQLFVGFGISNRQMAQQFINAGADGIIVGSQIINLYSKFIENNSINAKKALAEIEKLALELKEGQTGDYDD